MNGSLPNLSKKQQKSKPRVAPTAVEAVARGKDWELQIARRAERSKGFLGYEYETWQ